MPKHEYSYDLKNDECYHLSRILADEDNYTIYCKNMGILNPLVLLRDFMKDMDLWKEFTEYVKMRLEIERGVNNT